MYVFFYKSLNGRRIFFKLLAVTLVKISMFLNFYIQVNCLSTTSK